MKKITLIINLFFLFSFNILSQNYQYAWIPGIQFELPPARNFLENIVNDINNKKEISFVIITGSCSKDGKNEELDSVKNILNSLKVPYYIAPGTNDAQLNESCDIKFKDLWKDNKFEFDYNGTDYIGLNSGAFNRGKGHFRIEDLLWLDSLSAGLPAGKQLFIYSDFPGENGIDNLFEITNRLNNSIINAFFFSFQKAVPPAVFAGIPVISRKSAIDDENGWKYSLVKNTTDSIFIYNVTSSGIREKYEGFARNSSKAGKTDSVQFENFTSLTSKKSGIKAELLWQKNLNRTVLAPITAEGNNLYVPAYNGDIFCFDTSGSLVWQNNCAETIVSKPAISDSTLVLGTVSGDLISFNARSGKIIQTIGLNEPVTSRLTTTEAEYNGNSVIGVVAGTSKGSLYCYDINSFEQIWENHSAQGTIASEPLIINDRIIYGSSDGFLYCVDAKSGIINWKLLINNHGQMPFLCKPVSDGKSTFIASPDKNISSIDLMLGKTSWQKNNYDAYNSIGISDNKEEIYLKSYKDNFLIISAKTGKLIRNINVGFGLDTSPADILEWNKNILFASENGKIYLIDKSFKVYPLLFLGTSGVQNMCLLKDNIFAASTIDGKIFVFKLELNN